MRRIFTLFATAAFACSLAGVAAAASCKDAKGKFTKCPAAAAAPATGATPTPAAPKSAAPAKVAASTDGPKCVKGKRCGNACISVKDVCHK